MKQLQIDVSDDRGQKDVSAVTMGFSRSNLQQLTYHFLLAIFIGVTLRLTTFTEATSIAVALGDSYKVKTSFLVSFGFTKALSNLVVGRASDLCGRRIPHAIGWGFGILLGVMFLLLWRSAKDLENLGGGQWMFGYVVANMFLGAQQGWTWTSNIFMFIDILGPKHRALSASIPNSVGYLSAAMATYAAAALSTQAAFGTVLVTSILGWIISVYLVRDTSHFVQEEKAQTMYTKSMDDEPPIAADDISLGSCGSEEGVDDQASTQDHENFRVKRLDHRLHSSLIDDGENGSNDFINSSPLSYGEVFVSTCWRNPSTAILCAGGLTANLVTSLAWGLVLIWGKQQGLTKLSLANIESAFTFTKGIVMVLTGYISDRLNNRKSVLAGGFTIAMVGLGVTAAADLTDDLGAIYNRLLFGGIIIGLGIGSVYCVMTAALSDHTLPENRASAIGVYKLWRDSGYAFGGILTGWLADAFHGSFVSTTFVIAMLVGSLVLLIMFRYREVQIFLR